MGAINLEYIKHRRKHCKVNQGEMAVMLGLGSAAAYSPYESGKADFKAEHLPKICEALRCSITDLFNAGVLPNERSEKEMMQAVIKNNTEAIAHLNSLYKFLKSDLVHDAGKNIIEIEIEELSKDIFRNEAFGI